MTEKNIIAYKLFCHKIFQILIYFFGENCNPPEKSHPPLSQQTPSKSWGPIKPPFWKFGWRLNPPPPQQNKGDAHYVNKPANESFEWTPGLLVDSRH